MQIKDSETFVCMCQISHMTYLLVHIYYLDCGGTNWTVVGHYSLVYV